MQNYGKMSVDRVFGELATGRQGLTAAEAARRQTVYGANVIEKRKSNGVFKLFFSQFKDVMTLLLIAAAAISAVIAFLSGDSSDLTDTFIILFIIFLNAVVGTVQQYRADKAIEGLKKLSTTTAKVVRGGRQTVIDSAKLTVGDILCLDEGDLICADCRIIECSALSCDESALTGESQAVEKRENVSDQPTGALTAENMLFNGTFVVRGSAVAVVTAVGRKTQIGGIADLLDRAENVPSPLEKSLDKLGKIISVAVLAVAALIFASGALLGSGGILKNFMTAVAVAVAAIPEGLPAVVTIIMAMGVQRMSGENVIIRKLKSVETLGGCTCICTDKTGTLTQNRMSVAAVYANFAGEYACDPARPVDKKLLECMTVCSSVKGERGAYSGDPTEIALKNFADAFGVCPQVEKVNEQPFTSERKMMSVAAYVGGNSLLYTKGAPDILIGKCAYVLTDEGKRRLTDADRQRICRENDRMSDGALRVLAFAYKDCGAGGYGEDGLVFLGLCGLTDGLKEGIEEAVAECAKAGIKTVMITGDHVRTAFAVGKKAGIVSDLSEVVSGEQLDAMTAQARAKAVREGKVFARVTPAHKNLIVKIKRGAGEVVAMTGDGVNDAPSIKSADIGISMGKSGTDVTKNVADMVIADDNFTTIVAAVREGRRISSNIKKTIQFFLSTNLAEVIAVAVAALVFFRYDFLLSTQLLWINLITDSFPVLALGVEKQDFGAMNRPPVKAEKMLFSKSSVAFMAVSGAYMAGVTLGVYAFALCRFGNAAATTMTFLTVSFIELFHAFNVRTERESAFGKGMFSNKVLLATVAFGVAVNVALCFSPLSAAFGLTPLSFAQWMIVTSLSLSVVLFCEVYKFVLRLCTKKRAPRRGSGEDGARVGLRKGRALGAKGRRKVFRASPSGRSGRARRGEIKNGAEI